MSNNKYKILIVEDDRGIANFVQTVLETNGYQVLSADRCGQGILVFASHVPDLVILDLGLPDMDGEEFIRQIRGISAVPIIVLSARTEESDKVSALDLGANDYITKPFGTAELLARVRASLRMARHQAPASSHNGRFVLDDMTIDYDQAQLKVAIGTWDYKKYGGTKDSPVLINTTDESTFVDFFTDPSTIANGDLIISHDGYQINNGQKVSAATSTWIEYVIPIDYHTLTAYPTHVVISFASSRYGDYFSGYSGSKLWIDKVELIYE